VPARAGALRSFLMSSAWIRFASSPVTVQKKRSSEALAAELGRRRGGISVRRLWSVNSPSPAQIGQALSCHAIAGPPGKGPRRFAGIARKPDWLPRAARGRCFCTGIVDADRANQGGSNPAVKGRLGKSLLIVETPDLIEEFGRRGIVG
jgi:hypothetical protein